jgi:RimJ/RimL family protein N-acetyltransferase
MSQNRDLTSCAEDPAPARSSAGPSAHPIQALTNQNQPVTSLREDVAWPVRTKRLVLRPATLDDMEATWQIRRLESISRWLTRAPHALDVYRADFEDPASLEKSLVIELDTQVIGDLMVAVGDAWAQAEVADKAKGVQADLGWVIHPDFSGRGLATEAVREVLRICFEQLRLRRVTAECFSANEPSWRLMERLGMRRETHTISESLHRSGTWLDGFGYALLAEEWQAQEARS